LVCVVVLHVHEWCWRDGTNMRPPLLTHIVRYNITINRMSLMSTAANKLFSHKCHLTCQHRWLKMKLNRFRNLCNYFYKSVYRKSVVENRVIIWNSWTNFRKDKVKHTVEKIKPTVIGSPAATCCVHCSPRTSGKSHEDPSTHFGLSSILPCWLSHLMYFFFVSCFHRSSQGDPDDADISMNRRACTRTNHS
jgi:hypothetical protein